MYMLCVGRSWFPVVRQAQFGDCGGFVQLAVLNLGFHLLIGVHHSGAKGGFHRQQLDGKLNQKYTCEC